MKTMPTPRARRATLACAALLACAAATAQPRTTLSVMPLGGLTGAAEAWGLNDLGTVVGNHSMPGGASQPFAWQAGPTAPPQLLGLPGGAIGVGNGGTVVGSALFAGVGLRAFAWTSAAGLQNLGTLPGGGLSFATGVDDAGLITGISQVGGGSSHAFLLEPGAAMRDLGTLGGTTSQGHAIASGLVVGSSTDASGALQAFGWTAAGGLQGIGPIAEVSEARAVNRNGLIVGRAVVGGEDLPFLWTLGDRARLINGAEGFYGAAVNDAGQVLLRNSAGGNSMLWVEGGTPAKLHTLAGAGISNFEATAINGFAQVAGTATGTATGGVARPVLLTLHPEWQGGSGRWDSAGGAHWNWAGTGVAAVPVMSLHDVVIDPDVDASVITNGFFTDAHSLRVGGRGSRVVALQMAGGQVTVAGAATIAAGGSLEGQGRLQAGSIVILNNGQVRASGTMTLDAPWTLVGTVASAGVRNAGLLRVGDSPNGAPGRLDLPRGMANLAGGRVEVAAGELQQVGSILNQGLWTWSGDTRMGGNNSNGSFYNLVGGRVVYEAGHHQTLSRPGTLDNRGRIELRSGATWDLGKDIVSMGELDVASGAQLNLKATVAYISGATGGGRIEVHQRLLTAGGNAQGTGFIARVEPALALMPGSFLELRAMGVTPGAGLDKFILDGATELNGGGLRLLGVGGHVFEVGNVYDLFDWNGGVSGSFVALDLPTLAGGLTWDASDLYAGGTLSITAVPEPASWALLLAGGAAIAGLGRRRRR